MIPSVYLPAAAANGEFAVDAAKTRHLSVVLRLPEGAQVTVFDGNGNRYAATLFGERRAIKLKTGDKLPPAAADGGGKVTVGQAVCAPPKMDWAVEKMTELGVAKIAPLLGDKTRRAASASQVERWRRLAVAACEQCGRAVVPDISHALPLDKWLAALPDSGLRILLTPRAEISLAAVLRLRGEEKNKEIVLSCGTEAGFSAAEETRILNAGFTAAHLGARILRAETAALAALSVVQLAA